MAKTPINPFFDALAASQVLAVRLPILAAAIAQPGATPDKESVRMVTEKMSAVVEGTMAAQLYWWNAMAQFATAPLTAQAVEKTMTGAMEAFYAPARKTLHANAKRLSKR